MLFLDAFDDLRGRFRALSKAFNTVPPNTILAALALRFRTVRPAPSLSIAAGTPEWRSPAMAPRRSLSVIRLIQDIAHS